METKLAYLAGIIDGEGCVNINYNAKRNTHRMRVVVINTDKSLTDWLHENFGGLLYMREGKLQKNPKWKDRYEWHFVPSKERVEILKSFLPYLIVKRRQVEIAISFMDTVGSRGNRLSPEQFNLRESLYQELKKINSRGARFND